MLLGDVRGGVMLDKGMRLLKTKKSISRRPTADTIVAELRDKRSMTNPGEDSLLPFAWFTGVHTRRKGSILCENRGLEQRHWRKRIPRILRPRCGLRRASGELAALHGPVVHDNGFSFFSSPAQNNNTASTQWACGNCYRDNLARLLILRHPHLLLHLYLVSLGLPRNREYPLLRQLL